MLPSLAYDISIWESAPDRPAFGQGHAADCTFLDDLRRCVEFHAPTLPHGRWKYAGGPTAVDWADELRPPLPQILVGMSEPVALDYQAINLSSRQGTASSPPDAAREVFSGDRVAGSVGTGGGPAELGSTVSVQAVRDRQSVTFP